MSTKLRMVPLTRVERTWAIPNREMVLDTKAEDSFKSPGELIMALAVTLSVLTLLGSLIFWSSLGTLAGPQAGSGKRIP